MNQDKYRQALITIIEELTQLTDEKFLTYLAELKKVSTKADFHDLEVENKAIAGTLNQVANIFEEVLNDYDIQLQPMDS